MHDFTSSSSPSPLRVLLTGVDLAAVESLRTWLPATAQVETVADYLQAVGRLMGEPWDIVVAGMWEDPGDELRLWLRALDQAASRPRFIALVKQRSGSTSASSATGTLAEVEGQYIRKVLSETGGKIGEAARVLGIHRNTLARKLRGLGVRREGLAGSGVTF